jgi:hypothetical protein
LFTSSCSYEGEEGIDAGGVFKDWLGSISRELLKPGALFLPCLSASGASVRCLRLNPLPSEFGVVNEAQVSPLALCYYGSAAVTFGCCCRSCAFSASSSVFASDTISRSVFQWHPACSR